MAAKKDTKKQRTPEIAVIWKDNVPEATYFDRNGYKTVAKVEKGQYILSWDGWDEDPDKDQCIVVSAADTRRLMDSLHVKNPDTLIRVLGKKFALKEPHRAHLKILTSLDRRGIPYERK